jgi:hypothetical protein
LGVEGFLSQLQEKGHNFKQGMSLIMSAVDMQVAAERAQQEGTLESGIFQPLHLICAFLCLISTKILLQNY